MNIQLQTDKGKQMLRFSHSCTFLTEICFLILEYVLTAPPIISFLSTFRRARIAEFNPLNAELNPICHFLALLGVHHFLHVSRIRVKSLTLRLLMSYIYIYGAPILDVSR